MQTVNAIEKQTSRVRPVAVALAPIIREIVTTHSGICPICSRETRLRTGSSDATVYGSCIHFAGIDQLGTGIAVLFDAGRQ